MEYVKNVTLLSLLRFVSSMYYIKLCGEQHLRLSSTLVVPSRY